MPEITCSGCGAKATRTRTIFPNGGSPREECPGCNPGSFETIHSATDRKLWTGPEANPQDYEKIETKDGRTVYRSKDRVRADDEASMTQAANVDEDRAELIVAQRRQFGNRSPLTQTQIRARMLQVEAAMQR